MKYHRASKLHSLRSDESTGASYQQGHSCFIKGKIMAIHEYGITDFHYIAAGAAILASGGGGSYNDAVNVIKELCRCASLFRLNEI